MSNKKFTLEQLAAQIHEVLLQTPAGSLWRHYKGEVYRVNGVSVLEATNELAVRYSPVSNPAVEFVRPLSVWNETVIFKNHSVQRFEHIED